MTDTAIKAENISKLYRLGEIGTGTLSHDLNRWWAKMRGKEDPFARIGELNDRSKKGNGDYVWSLKDINFEIKQGDSVGIIGRNGAGKSTLLKLLSRVTAPTAGAIRSRGRISSLLEVGTGFHPELTGRENIYLNGAILGMRKKEITRKLDQIVDFSGVERYIDTPVKRYSSGMYVRLAFAVAANLENEILIVDEVLAVGDVEFQNKCLGKMKDVSGKEGRTVLFVSHNMGAIQKLCTSGILLKDGLLNKQGEIESVINEYLKNDFTMSAVVEIDPESLTPQQLESGYAESIHIEDMQGNPLPKIAIGEHWQTRVRFRINKSFDHFIIAIGLWSSSQVAIGTSWSMARRIEKGIYEAIFKYDQILLASGNYTLTLGLSNYEKSFHYIEHAIDLEVADVKDNSVKNDLQLIRTSNSGIILNQAKIIINKHNGHEFEKI
jgi:lipopolysaccharide transport system ATP-binding protein